MKILLSEGEEIRLEGMRSILLNHGYQVKSCLYAKEFFKECSPKYDIIIMDLDLLKTAALEMAHNIDAWMTNSIAKPCKLIATYKEGICYYNASLFSAGLTKPFTKEKLLEVIDKEYANVKRFNDKRSSQDTWSIDKYNMVQNREKNHQKRI